MRLASTIYRDMEPVLGDQNHVSIDRGFGVIRKWSATDAASEGRQLRERILDKTDLASGTPSACSADAEFQRCAASFRCLLGSQNL